MSGCPRSSKSEGRACCGEGVWLQWPKSGKLLRDRGYFSFALSPGFTFSIFALVWLGYLRWCWNLCRHGSRLYHECCQLVPVCSGHLHPCEHCYQGWTWSGNHRLPQFKNQLIHPSELYSAQHVDSIHLWSSWCSMTWEWDQEAQWYWRPLAGPEKSTRTHSPVSLPGKIISQLDECHLSEQLGVWL